MKADTGECKRFDFKCKSKKFIDETKEFQKKGLDQGKEQIKKTTDQIKKISPLRK